MDTSAAAAQAYRSNEISDASPVRAVAILYDRAIEALNQAIRGIEKRDVNHRWKNNRKATDILISLNNCLDHDKGGEIAVNLARLYDFMIMRLMRVDVNNDVQAARDVIGLLEPLRKSWHELADRADKEPDLQRLIAAPVAEAPAPEAPAAARPAAPPVRGYGTAAAPARPEGAQIVI